MRGESMSFITNWLQKVLENLLPPAQAAQKLRHTLKTIKSSYLYPFVFGLICLMTIALAVRYTSSYYGLASRYRAILPDDEWQIIAQNDVWNSSLVTIVIYALCLGGLLAAIAGLLAKKLARTFSVSLLIACAIGAILNFSFPTVHRYEVKRVQANVYLEALELLEQGEASVALDRLNSMYPDFVGTSLEDDLLGRMGQAYYMTQNFRESIRIYARTLYEKPNSPIRSNIEQSLHWSIYGLAQQEGLEAGVEYVMQVQSVYPSDHVSVAWTVVPPNIEGELWLHPLQVLGYVRQARLYDDYLVTKAQMRDLVAKYPYDPYIDVVSFLLGDFVEIMQDDRSPIRDLAFYAQANRLRREGDLEGAISVYSAYLDTFPHTPLSDDVACDLAVTYRMTGNYRAAWTALCLASVLPDGDMRYSTELEAVRMLDLLVPIEEFESLRSASGSYCAIMNVLEYSYGERLMAEGEFASARAQFEKVKSLYPTSEAASWCDHNIEIIERFMAITRSSQDDKKLQFAEFLADNFNAYSLDSDPCDPSHLTFYNELWRYRRRDALYVEQQNPNISADTIVDYYKHHSDFLVALRIVEEFIVEHPHHPRIMDAMWLRARLYRQLSVDSAFLPSVIESMTQQAMREKAHLAYQDIVDLNPGVDQAVQAMAERAQIYLLRPYDYQRAITEFRRLVHAYPDHHLANNALMWVARLSWWMAKREYFEGDALLANALAIQAKQAYEEILNNSSYCMGHVGEEAGEELRLLEKWRAKQTQ